MRRAAEFERYWNQYFCTGRNISHHAGNKPGLSIHINAGIYCDIHINSISRDFYLSWSRLWQNPKSKGQNNWQRFHTAEQVKANSYNYTAGFWFLHITVKCKQLLYVSCWNHIFQPLRLGFIKNQRKKPSWHCKIKVKDFAIFDEASHVVSCSSQLSTHTQMQLTWAS